MQQGVSSKREEVLTGPDNKKDERKRKEKRGGDGGHVYIMFGGREDYTYLDDQYCWVQVSRLFILRMKRKNRRPT